MKRNKSTYEELRTNHHYATLLKRLILVNDYIKYCIYSVIVVLVALYCLGTPIEYTFSLKGLITIIILVLILAFFWLKYDLKHDLSKMVTNAKNVMENSGARTINNNVKELEYRDIVSEMAIANHIPKPQAYIINSNKYNALCTSNLKKENGQFSGNSYIAITSGILNDFSRGQIECIVGDEIARIVSGDVFTDLLVTDLLINNHRYFLNLKTQFLFDYFKLDTNADGQTTKGDGSRHFWLGWIHFLVARLIHMPMLLMICKFAKKFSNNRDFNADIGSVQINNDPTDLIQALKMCNQNPAINSFDIYSNDLYFLSKYAHISEENLNHYNLNNPHHLNINADKYILDALNTHTTISQRIQHIKRLSNN